MKKKILIGIGIILGFFILIGIIGSNPQKPQVGSTQVQGTVAGENTQATSTPSPTVFPEESIVGGSVYTNDNGQVIPRATPTAKSVQDSGLSNDNTYVNSQGNTVHSPAYSNRAPVGATAVCRDGAYSFSQSRRGTCSYHGGVSQWL